MTEKTTAQLLTEYNSMVPADKQLKAWKDSKAKLQARIDAAYEELAKTMTSTPVASKENTAAYWARKLGKNPKVVRAKLRLLGLSTRGIDEGSKTWQTINNIKARSELS